MSTPLPLPFDNTQAFTVSRGFSLFDHVDAQKFGVDFEMPYGTEVKAMASGEIVAFQQGIEPTFMMGPAGSSTGVGLGNYVTVRSDIGGNIIYITYGNLEKDFLLDLSDPNNVTGPAVPSAPFTGQSYGTFGFGEVIGKTGATGLRSTNEPAPSMDDPMDPRGAHLHVHVGTMTTKVENDPNTAEDDEFIADATNDTTLPVFWEAFGVMDGVPTSPTFGASFPGSDYAAFSDPAAPRPDFVVPPSQTVSFGEVVDATNLGTGDAVIDAFLTEVFGNQISDGKFTGDLESAFFIRDLSVPGGFSGDSGFLLSSGGLPGATNSDPRFTVDHQAPGDADLENTAKSAFLNAGESNDASVVEFTVNATGGVDAIEFAFVFGSEEFPVFVDTSFVDVAAIYINGENVALYNGDPTTPLSITANSTNPAYWKDNTNNDFPIEWNGFSTTQIVRAPLKPGENTVKIGVADTGDFELDSGIYVSNIELLSGGSSVGGILALLESKDDTVNVEVVPVTTSAEKVVLGLGAKQVTGTPEELNGDLIENFADDDTLKVKDVTFTKEDLTVTLGSAILDIDTDGDGTQETTVTLEGDFTDKEFFVSSADDGTVISLSDPNAAPVAQADVITVTEGGTVSGNVFADNGNGPDTDADGDTLTVTASSTGNIPGGLTINSDGSFTYAATDPSFATQEPGTTASTTFTYTVSDGKGATATGTGQIDVAIVDNPTTGTPTLIGEALEGTTVFVSAANVADPEGPLTLTYLWRENGDPIPNATGQSYSLGARDVGNQLSVDVTATDPFGAATSFTLQAGEVDFEDQTVRGTRNDDRITTSGGDDTIKGRGGNDVLKGKDGNDKIGGGGGNDRVVGGNGKDDLNGNGGKDTVSGGKGNDTAKGGGGNDKVNGGAGNDNLKGANGNDTLKDGGGNDKVDGGKGEDLIIVGGGNDTLKGGDDADTFRYAANSGKSRITDFDPSEDLFEIRTGAESFDDLTFGARPNGDGLITFGNVEIRVDGVSEATLTNSDLFAFI